MNRLNDEKQVQILQCLIEGNSIRSTSRMTGAAQGTILTLLQTVGDACQEFHDKNVAGLTCQRIQADEIWNFCQMKEKNVPPEHRGELGFGDVYTWTALDAGSRLMINWRVGRRDHQNAIAFIADLKTRINNRPQITTDGLSHYFDAVDFAFGEDVDFAIIRKLFGTQPGIPKGRYSPAVVTGAIREKIKGYPLQTHVSTSYVERQNLTMRMSMRRFTRLTNAFSKKIEKLQAAVALHFVHYNFVRVHRSLDETPAMRAGLTKHVWTLQEVLNLTKTYAIIPPRPN